MLKTSAWRPFPRYMAEPEREPDHEDASHPDVTPQEHDLILRYAIVAIALIMAMAALHVSQVISLPITAGIIFGLVLGPVVDWMVKHSVPQHAAAGIVVLLFLALILSALSVLAVPLAGLSDQAPAMLAALQRKLGGLITGIDDLKAALGKVTGSSGMELKVAQNDPLMMIALSSSTIAGGALIFIATIYFWLATRRHLKARILRLCLGRGARKSAGAFFYEIEARVARYFGLVTIINLGMGLVTAVIAWAAGLPFPVFWGALAFLLNYLAFIGPIIVTVMIFAGALLDAPTPWAAFLPTAAYFVVHLIEGNLVTPLVVGRSMTVSPFLVFTGFLFWLWMWGPAGAVLSTPILLVAMVAREEFVAYREAQAEEAKSEDEARPVKVVADETAAIDGTAFAGAR